jgi:hypothetical protein
MVENPVLLGIGIGIGAAVGTSAMTWAFKSLSNVINGFFETIRYRRMGVSDQVILDHVPRMEKRGQFYACRAKCPICTDLNLPLLFDSTMSAYPPGYQEHTDT